MHITTLCAFISAAYAGCSGTTTIANSGDAKALASCTTYSGNVVVATGTTDGIDLGTLKRITGNLSAFNATYITSLGGASLEQIDGTFTIDTMQVLSGLSFNLLTIVGNIVWNALPSLQVMNFTTGINQVSMVDIQNTELNSMDGFNVKSADSVYIANNKYIGRISIPFTLINTSMILEANNPAVNVSFPDLRWINNMTMRNISSLDIPSLNFVNGSLGLIGNRITSFSANALSTIRQSLLIRSNTRLTDISMPKLLSSGRLQMADNTLITSVEGFPQLGSVDHTIELSGNFSSVTLPDLKRAGTLTMNSSNSSLDCSFFDNYLNTGVIESYTCNGKAHQPNASSPRTSSSAAPNTSPSSTGQPSDHSKGLSRGAKAGIGVGAAVGGLSLLATGGFLLSRRRMRDAPPAPEAAVEYLKAELDGGDHRREVGGYEHPGELATAQEAFELPAPHGVRELD